MFWQWSHPLVGGGAGWLLWEVSSWPLNFQEEVCSQEHPSTPPFHPPCDPKPPGRTNSSMFGQLAPHPGQPSGLSVSHARNSREGLGGGGEKGSLPQGSSQKESLEKVGSQSRGNSLGEASGMQTGQRVRRACSLGDAQLSTLGCS